MPAIGEIQPSHQIGHKGTHKNIWVACDICGKERWVQLNKRSIPISRVCHECRGSREQGENHPLWKGGRRRKDGYIQIWIHPDNFFSSMADRDNVVMEHRLVMAKHIGRCLHSWEVVHHRNGIKDDNRIENLELSTRGSHSLRHAKGYEDGYSKGLRDGRLAQIKQLKQEIESLKRQLNIKKEETDQ